MIPVLPTAQHFHFKHPSKGHKVNIPCNIPCTVKSALNMAPDVNGQTHLSYTSVFSPSLISTTFVSIRSYFTLCECLILALSSRADMQTGDYAAVRESACSCSLIHHNWEAAALTLSVVNLPNLMNGKI